MSSYVMRLVYKDTHEYYQSIYLSEKDFRYYQESWFNGCLDNMFIIVLDVDNTCWYLDMHKCEIDIMWIDGKKE
nr:MAG: hypothetical protein [Microvirus Sku218]